MSIESTNPMATSERSNHSDHDPSDDLLLERVRGRNQQAMADVFDRYGGLVYSVALRVLKEKEQAREDY